MFAMMGRVARRPCCVQSGWPTTFGRSGVWSLEVVDDCECGSGCGAVQRPPPFALYTPRAARLPACWPAGPGGVRRREKADSQARRRREAAGIMSPVRDTGRRRRRRRQRSEPEREGGDPCGCACSSGVLGLEAPGTGGRWGVPAPDDAPPRNDDDDADDAGIWQAFMFCMREVGSIFFLAFKPANLPCDGIRRPAGVIPSSTGHLHPSTSNTNASTSTSTNWQVTHRGRWLTSNVGSDGMSASHRRFGGRIPGADAVDGTRMQARHSHARLPGSLLKPKSSTS